MCSTNTYNKDILYHYVYYGWDKLLKEYSNQLTKIGKERCSDVPLCEQTKDRLRVPSQL